MNEYGMPTLIELPSIDDCAELCSELGLRFIELNMCLPQFQVENFDVQKLIEISKNLNIYYTIHLDDTNTPCDFNPKIAKAYTDTVLQTIEIAKQLHIPILNMHLSLGTHFTLPNKKVLLFEEYKEVYLRNLKLFRDKCEASIGSANIKICVENTRAFTHHIGLESLSLLLESPVFAVTFDVGHDASNHFSQRPAIEKYIDRLMHIHLHDTIAEAHQDHLPLCDGELELQQYLDLANNHNCRVVIEVKTVEGLKKSVECLKTVLKVKSTDKKEGIS